MLPIIYCLCEKSVRQKGRKHPTSFTTEKYRKVVDHVSIDFSKGIILLSVWLQNPQVQKHWVWFFFMEQFLWAMYLMCIFTRIGTRTHSTSQIKFNTTHKYHVKLAWHYDVVTLLHVYAQRNVLVTVCTISSKKVTPQMPPTSTGKRNRFIFQFFFEWLKYNGTPLSEWAFDQFKWWVLGVPNLLPRKYSS